MLLVTGGAGFIGANFILDWCAGERRADRQSRQAHLRRQSRQSGRAEERSSPRLRSRRHRRPRAGRCAARPVHAARRCSISPRKATSTARSTARRTSSRPTSSAPSRCSRRRATTGVALDEPERSRFRFLHVSTDEVYGSLGPADPPFTRDDARTRPTARTPHRRPAADHLVRAYHHTYGLPTLTTNCSNNYGPYQFPEKLIPLDDPQRAHRQAAARSTATA